jgi:uncharacterized membrane protein (UPF0127 family)
VTSPRAYRAYGPGRRFVLDDLRPAHTHWTRLRGLIGRPPLQSGQGLWIRPCRQVHMFWMRHPLDVLFLDAEHRLVHVEPDLQPGRLSPKITGAESVIEVAAGCAAAHALSAGDQLTIEPAAA